MTELDIISGGAEAYKSPEKAEEFYERLLFQIRNEGFPVDADVFLDLFTYFFDYDQGEMPDTDHDGILDVNDFDDDNDGITDMFDDDDDGDGIPDEDEEDGNAGGDTQYR